MWRWAIKIRPGSARAVAAFAERGIETTLISGDAARTVERVAQALNIPAWQARVSPLDKAAAVEQKRSALPKGQTVAMAGDGVNDAPALAKSDVGIAMATGTQIAARAAQVTLLTPDLSLIPPLIDLSRRTVAVMRQNLFWALSYNLVCIPAAMLGAVRPIWAVIAMLVSSLTVILNTRRIRWD